MSVSDKVRRASVGPKAPDIISVTGKKCFSSTRLGFGEAPDAKTDRDVCSIECLKALKR